MMAATNLLGSQRHHSFGHPKSYYPFRIWTLGHPVLRRGIIVVFVALALLLFDWESPSPDSTLVLDAFDALAETSQEQEFRPLIESTRFETEGRGDRTG